MDTDTSQQNDGLEGKREGARHMAEAALAARAAGETDRADLLLEEASKTDPEAVAEVMAQHPGETGPGGDADVPNDDEVAAISRTIEPHSAAPSRSGITGSGSGGDGQR